MQFFFRCQVNFGRGPVAALPRPCSLAAYFIIRKDDLRASSGDGRKTDETFAGTKICFLFLTSIISRKYDSGREESPSSMMEGGL
jgi:hypothetical protein